MGEEGRGGGCEPGGGLGAVVSEGVGGQAGFDVRGFPVELVDEVVGGVEAEGSAGGRVFVGEFEGFDAGWEVLSFGDGLF